MSESSNVRRRRPWWAFGIDVPSSLLLVVVFGFMLVSSIVRSAADPNGWDVAMWAILAGLVVAALASIVHFVRNPPASRQQHGQ